MADTEDTDLVLTTGKAPVLPDRLAEQFGISIYSHPFAEAVGCCMAVGLYIVYSFFTETRRLCERIPELYDGSSNNKPVVTHVYMCYSLVAVFVSLLVYLAFLLIF